MKSDDNTIMWPNWVEDRLMIKRLLVWRKTWFTGVFYLWSLFVFEEFLYSLIKSWKLVHKCQTEVTSIIMHYKILFNPIFTEWTFLIITFYVKLLPDVFCVILASLLWLYVLTRNKTLFRRWKLWETVIRWST